MTSPLKLQSKNREVASEGARELIVAQGSMPALPIQFMPVTDFTTFSAEVAVSEGDFIYHFYATDEVNKGANPRQYWLELFPSILEKAAQEYFKATFPRLKAAYTEEKASWWLRAYGFGRVLDPHKLSLGFCDKLDAALESALVPEGTPRGG